MARSRARPKRLWLWVAGFAVAALAIAIAVVILALPGWDHRTATTWIADEQTCYFGHPPHARESVDREGKLHYDLETDGDGFRIGSERRPSHPKCKVLAVGDSFTVGFWVTADEAWPRMLERRLGELGYSVRVDNGGMQGQTMQQERANILSRWAPLQHDIVIVGASANDLNDTAQLVRTGCDLQQIVPAERLKLLATGSGQDSHLDLLVQEGRAQLISTTAKMRAILEGHGMYRPEAAAECDAAADTYLRQTVETARDVKKLGHRLLFAGLQPLACEWGTNRWNEAEIRPFATRLNDALVGEGAAVETDFQLYGEQSLAPVDNHPSPVGHATIAETLANRLIALGWLESCKE